MPHSFCVFLFFFSSSLLPHFLRIIAWSLSNCTEPCSCGEIKTYIGSRLDWIGSWKKTDRDVGGRGGGMGGDDETDKGRNIKKQMETCLGEPMEKCGWEIGKRKTS